MRLPLKQHNRAQSVPEPGNYSVLCAAYLADLSASNWLKSAIKALDKRDPVDALNDLNCISKLTQMRCDEVLKRAQDQIENSAKQGDNT